MDLRQEAERIFDGLAWYQDNLGEGLIWHEFDSSTAEYHVTYDEGGRKYRAGVLIPVLWVIVNEDRSNRSDQGRKPTERLTAAISMRSLHLSGISDPEDYTRRLNDVIRYDERIWKVTDFNIRGRVPGSVIVGVTAVQVFADEEMVFDTLPPGMTAEGSTRPYAYPNNAEPDFLFHDIPEGYNSLYVDFDADTTLDGGTA